MSADVVTLIAMETTILTFNTTSNCYTNSFGYYYKFLWHYRLEQLVNAIIPFYYNTIIYTVNPYRSPGVYFL